MLAHEEDIGSPNVTAFRVLIVECAAPENDRAISKAFWPSPEALSLISHDLSEGWPVPEPSVYALPPGLQERMDPLLAAGDRNGVVDALFRGVENLSGEDMAALKAAPSWSDRVAAAHTVTAKYAESRQLGSVTKLLRKSPFQFF